MANTTVSNRPAVIEITTAPSVIKMETNRRYSVQHLGKTAAGVDSSETVFIGTGEASITSDFSAEPEKGVLLAGSVFTLPPDNGSVTMETAAASVVVQIVPGERVTKGF